MPDFTASRTVLEKRAIGIPGVRMLGQYRYLAARSGLKPHTHPGSLEICLLVKGRQSYRVGESIYRLKGGEQFVTFPDEKHDTGGYPEEKSILYWLIIDFPPEEKGILFLTPPATATLIAGLQRLPARHFHADPQSQAGLDRVFELLKAPKTPLKRLEAAHRLTHYLFQTIAASNTGAIPQVSPRIQKCLDYVAAHGNGWISVPTLAEKSGLSEPRFKARFRTEMGLPPGEFMLRRKIETAKERLAQRTETITGVAYSLGFSSSQYFATVFRRYTHQTPSEFLAAKPGGNPNQ